MRLAALLLLWVCFVPFAVVRGADGYDVTEYPHSTLVTQTGDYFVVIEQPSTFTAETDLCDNTTAFWCADPDQGGNFTDSALWLYDANGGLLTSNDDDPRTNGQSYHSFITVQLEAGVYRLRAGRFTCRDGSCMWPQDPFPEGGHYQLLTTRALLLDPTPPTVVPSAIPSVLPTPEPTPTPTLEPTPEPTPTQTPEPPSPSPSVAPTPTPEPSVEPTPTPEPTPPPTPEPTPTPTEPPPTVAPTQEPTNEPPPNPTATPQPTPEGTVEPSPPASPPPSPDPTPLPPPEPTQPPLPTVEEVAAAVEEAVAAAAEVVGESVAAIGGGIADIAAIGDIGKDLDATEKEEVQPVAVAVVSSQIASVAAAAANAARTGGGSTPSGGNLGGGGGGGADAPKTRKTSSRKELK